jgi:hypothetical protein
MLHLALARSGLERAVRSRREGDVIVALFPCVLQDGVLGASGIVRGGTVTPQKLCELILKNSPRIVSWR